VPDVNVEGHTLPASTAGVSPLPTAQTSS
jgi:hypothetical protein